MLNLDKILVDGGLFALIGSFYILAMMRFNPRLFLNPGDLPADILAAVPPKTVQEKRLAILLGIPFLAGIVAIPVISTLQFRQQMGGEVAFLYLFLHPFAILLIFNLFDLLILDLLLFCTFTPRFMVIPGTEGLAGYRDYGFHLRQHLKSLIFLVLGSLIIALGVSLA
jgi:hypothetical protein